MFELIIFMKNVVLLELYLRLIIMRVLYINIVPVFLVLNFVINYLRKLSTLLICTRLKLDLRPIPTKPICSRPTAIVGQLKLAE